MTVKKIKEYLGDLPEEITDPGQVIYDLSHMIHKLPESPSPSDRERLKFYEIQHNNIIEGYKKEVERLKGLIEKAFDAGMDYAGLDGINEMDFEAFKTENNL